MLIFSLLWKGSNTDIWTELYTASWQLDIAGSLHLSSKQSEQVTFYLAAHEKQFFSPFILPGNDLPSIEKHLNPFNAEQLASKHDQNQNVRIALSA